MKRIAVSIILSFLLFSVAAETFSALFITDNDHIVLTDNEDNSKEEKKEREEKEESFKNKISGNYLEMHSRDNYLVARINPFTPDDAKDTHKGFSSLPELPPRRA